MYFFFQRSENEPCDKMARSITKKNYTALGFEGESVDKKVCKLKMEQRSDWLISLYATSRLKCNTREELLTYKMSHILNGYHKFRSEAWVWFLCHNLTFFLSILMIFFFLSFLSLLWTFSGVQAEVGQGDPGPEGAAVSFEQSPRWTVQLFKLTEV